MGKGIALLLCLLLLAGAASSARADHEETEHRLKSAGVDDELRASIHNAIDRGVRWLLRVQRADGSFPNDSAVTWYANAGQTVVAALALRHADTVDSRKGATRAVRHLLAPRSKSWKEVRDEVYLAGFGLMLLQAEGGHDAAVKEIATRLADSLDKDNDWWGYLTRPDRMGNRGRGFTDFVNLSTSQFGALGLWAGARAGAEVPMSTWKRHLLSLLSTQTPTGSWPYNHNQLVGYQTGTFMGLANLLLAEEALADEIRDDPGLAYRVRTIKRRGLEALDRDGVAYLESLGARAGASSWPFYGLYALEKVCVFADREKVGGVPWYIEGARFLLRVQRKDGSWFYRFGRQVNWPPKGDESRIVDTTFALLFLLRISETYHPVTPRLIRNSPVTPGADKPDDAPAVPPDPGKPTGYVDLATAMAVVERLTSLLSSPEPRTEDVFSALAMLDTVYHNLAPDQHPGKVEEFRQAAEKAALKAFLTTRIRAREKENLRAAANARAARFLGTTRAEVAPLLEKLIKSRLTSKLEAGEVFWFRAFEALLALAPKDGLRFLRRTVITEKHARARPAVCRAALDAIATAPDLPEKDRGLTARYLVTVFGQRERVAGANRMKGVEDGLWWRALRVPVLLALESLLRDADSGAVPRTTKGWPGGVQFYGEWMRRRPR